LFGLGDKSALFIIDIAEIVLQLNAAMIFGFRESLLTAAEGATFETSCRFPLRDQEGLPKHTQSGVSWLGREWRHRAPSDPLFQEWPGYSE
jgi:hypothetical protein